jgi:hypothetical protein
VGRERTTDCGLRLCCPAEAGAFFICCLLWRFWQDTMKEEGRKTVKSISSFLKITEEFFKNTKVYDCIT